MPYRVRKQKCKKSDESSGAYVIQKKKSGKWKKASCHSSEEKAKSAVRARGMHEDDKLLDEAFYYRVVQRVLDLYKE